MRGAPAALAALLLAFSGCAPSLPPGVRRAAADAENHDFALDLPRGRVLYVHGGYPRKSYLCVDDLHNGRHRRFRLAGKSLGGGVYPLRDGRSAFVLAAPISGSMTAPSAAPRDRELLRVDLSTGKVLRSFALPMGARVKALAESSWSSAPLVAIQDRGGLRLAQLGAAKDLAESSVTLSSDNVGEVAIAEDYPVVAAAAWSESGAVLRFFETGSGRMDREISLRSPGLLRSLGSGRWLLTLRDDNGSDVVAELDAAGRLKPLLSTSGAIETMVAGDRWLIAISQATQGHWDKRRKWLRPRDIHRVDLSGREPPWSAPWTQRQGSLLALDAPSRLLYFAVTDRDAAAVWSIPAAPQSLAAAAAAIDGPSPFLFAWRRR